MALNTLPYKTWRPILHYIQVQGRSLLFTTKCKASDFDKSLKDRKVRHKYFGMEPELEKNFKHYFEETGYYSQDAIYLLMGAPGNNTLKQCADILQQATVHRMSEEKEEGNLFQYGCSLGDWKFRVNLAKFLRKQYQEPTYMQNLMLTCGATHGLYLTVSLLLGSGGLVFVEDPTYFIALKVLSDDLKMTVVPVPMDDEGIIITSLEDSIKQHYSKQQPQRDYPFKAMVYLVPAFHNPMGFCYSEERCKKLIDMARKHNLLLFCDDVYNLLCYKDEKPPKPLFYYDEISGNHTGNVISNGSFTKILAPGLRVGWIQSSEHIINFFKHSNVIRSGGAVNNYMSGIMSSVLELGLQDQHLKLLKTLYSHRMSRVCQILQEELPEDCSFMSPSGGYFIWITLPKDFDAEKFSKWAKDRYQVAVQPGNRFSAEGNFRNCIRIAISFYEDDILWDAARKLTVALKEYKELKE